MRIALLLTLFIFIVPFSVIAQVDPEIDIDIGKSQANSTSIGVVTEIVEPTGSQTKLLIISSMTEGKIMVIFGPKTKVIIDQSRHNIKNKLGSDKDIKLGSLIEVHPKGNPNNSVTANWIKISFE